MLETESWWTQSEHYSRNSNIELKGIPNCNYEDTFFILAKVGDLIGEPTASSDIETYRPVFTRIQGESNIIVQCKRHHQRDTFLEKARAKRICTSDLAFPFTRPVYFNERLCPALKRGWN